MNINYKFIEHERLCDAPFIGALISACNCDFNCKNCFNQHIKDMPTHIDSSENIINKIKSNPFNQGVIFSGLEWTLQIDELNEMCAQAKKKDLKTILFTGNQLENIKKLKLNINNLDFIKCGVFDESLKTINHIEHGVILATSNQHIYAKRIDY